MIDNEELWWNYETEEAEVQVDTTDMILERMIMDVIDTMFEIEMKRKYERLSSIC